MKTTMFQGREQEIQRIYKGANDGPTLVIIRPDPVTQQERATNRARINRVCNDIIDSLEQDVATGKDTYDAILGRIDAEEKRRKAFSEQFNIQKIYDADE